MLTGFGEYQFFFCLIICFEHGLLCYYYISINIMFIFKYFDMVLFIDITIL